MRWLFLLLTLGIAGLAFLAALATAPAPAIERLATLSLADLERGRRIVESLDLKHLKEGQQRQVRISREDLELGLNWLVGSLGRGGAAVNIGPQRLDLQVSVRLGRLARYLNLGIVFLPAGDLLVPAQLRLGKLPLPAKFTGKLLGGLLAISPAAAQYRVLRKMLRGAALEPGHLRLTLVWRGAELSLALQHSGWHPAGVDAATLERYRARLVKLKGHDYAAYLRAAFVLARERSGKGDPVAENRSALAAMAELALGSRLITTPTGTRLPRNLGLRLADREDSAQHFSLSALIAAVGGEGVSDLAGLYKELRDAKGGSGFSFNDLAADKAGSRLGELATKSPESARRLQARLAGIGGSAEFFPKIEDLPESMSQSLFEQRFGGVGQPAYNRMVTEIEHRIAGLAVYRK